MRLAGVKLREKSAGGVVVNQGRVLVLRLLSGEWVMPKGKVEEDETDAAAAIREVKEETGLDALIGRSLGSTEYEYALNGRKVHKSVHWFLMQSYDAQLKPEPIFAEAKFVAPDEAIKLLTHANDRSMVERARDALGAG
jgi:8-oxo-dGTP pyrophosphatase MutT (NUDIX family)